MKNSNTIPLQIKLGEEKILSFKSLATAGYFWQYTIEKAKIIEIKKIDSKKEENNMLIGASVNEVFKITAIGIGSATLVFSQVRSWEKNVAATTIKCYQVMVVP